MKKFLSLVLALAMTLSLVTISAGAKDFADSDELTGEQYEEAVNVMSEMGIIDGYASGDFQPQGTLTRGAAAKIIACMMLGKTTAEALGTQAAPFKDVPAGSTFAGYIAYCVESGLIDGYADGTFRPSNTLTGFAFLKMLLTALGYDSTIEGYTGTNWTVNVAGRATQIGLTDGNDAFVGTRAATREEACLYAVNALQATLVEYENKGQEITVSDGTVITVRPSAPTYVTSSISGAATSIDDTIDNTTHDYTVEFAERYQPDLELSHDTDDFMRPAHTWSWKDKEIGTYVDFDKMVAEYTTEVTGDEIYDLLSASTIRDNDVLSYVDGGAGTVEKNDLVRNNRTELDDTGDGVLTQVFVDSGRKEITIASINTYLAKATSSYSTTSETAALRVYETNSTGTTKTVDVDDVPEVANVEKDAFYAVTMSRKHSTNNALQVVTIAEPQVMENSTVTKWSRDDELVVSKLTTGGTEYKANVKAYFDDDTLEDYDLDLLTDMTYNVYLDQYGYILGVELYEGERNYVFITGYDRFGSYISVKTADAAAIFTDGSMDEITVDVSATDDNITAFRSNPDYTSAQKALYTTWTRSGDEQLNRWYTYTVDANNVYTLKPVSRMVATNVADDGDPTKIDRIVDCSNVYLDGNLPGTNSTRVYGNDNSVFITAETGTVDLGSQYAITDTTGAYTGVQEVEIEVNNDSKLEAEIYTVYDKDQYVIASVIVGEARGNVTNYAYILSDVKSEEKIDDTYYWTFDAATREGIVTLTATSKYRSTISQLVKNTIEELRFTGDYVSKIIPLTMDVTALDTVINAGSDETYHVTGLVDRDMYLQGRTLWVENSPVASGLTFVSDANAVVIQPVNGKETKTAYSSVEEAISSLGDYDKTADGLQFCGDIAAVLNNQGVAEWIVFKSTVDAGSGEGPGYGEDSNRGVTATSSINGFGQVRVNLTVTRPSYVPQSADVYVRYNVYVNGSLALMNEPATISGGTNTVVSNAGFLANNSSDTVSVQITRVSYEEVKATYSGLAVVKNNTTATDEVLTVGATTMKFTLDTTATSGTVNYTVKQGNTTLKSGSHNLASGKQITVTGMTAVVDTAAVTVEITGTVVPNYTVTGLDGSKTLKELYAGTPTGAENIKLTVTPSRTTVGEGGTVTWTYSVDTGVANTYNYGVRITLSTGAVLELKNDASTTIVEKVDPLTTVNGNVTVSVTKVEEIAPPTILSVRFLDNNGDGEYNSGDQFEITFSDKIGDSNITATAPNMGITGGAWSSNDTVLTITINTISASASYDITSLTSADTGVKNTGTWSIAVDNTETNANENSLEAVYTAAT